MLTFAKGDEHVELSQIQQKGNKKSCAINTNMKWVKFWGLIKGGNYKFAVFMKIKKKSIGIFLYISSFFFVKSRNLSGISLHLEKISEISTSGLLKSVKFNNNRYRYNLIIICAGNNSSLVKNLFNDQFIENSYGESAITTILNQTPFKNNTVRQIFLDNEIFALLPISNTREEQGKGWIQRADSQPRMCENQVLRS